MLLSHIFSKIRVYFALVWTIKVVHSFDYQLNKIRLEMIRGDKYGQARIMNERTNVWSAALRNVLDNYYD